ncbi:MFS transporter [Sphingobium yanoikuyae]|uniref:MFS transporter n=1 Tax=Sphingobium yanoikuyae TaxID=13690 RepID=UPI00345F0090
MAETDTSNTAPASRPAGRYRWTIVALLFAATVINYVDRQMIGVLKPTLSKELGWSEGNFADVIFYFTMAYGLGFLVFGKLMDVLGARRGYALAFLIWQAAHIGHGLASNLIQFSIARFALGIGEAGNFPAAIKAVTEWFPARERAFAIGIFNAGSNIGAIITPLLVPLIALNFGWRAAFVVTGVVSLVWLVAWLAVYRPPAHHPRLSTEERAWIEQDGEVQQSVIPWSAVIRTRQLWAFALGKFCIDPIWWFFLFWLPGYLGDRYGLDLLSFGPPLVAIYLLSDVGSVAGGWFSSRLISRGMSVNRARKTTMLICAAAVLPIFMVQSVDHLWGAVLLIGLATAAHQAFSANLYALVPDLFPRAAVGSVTGIGGTAGALGGMVMAKYAGFVLDTMNSYAPLFAVAGTAYFVALACVHGLSPRLRQVRFEARAAPAGA